MAVTMEPRLVEQMLAALHGAEGRWGPSAEPLPVALRLESAEDLKAAAQALRSWGAEVVSSEPEGPTMVCRLPAERLWDLLGMEGLLEVSGRDVPRPRRASRLRWVGLSAGVLTLALALFWALGQGAFGPSTVRTAGGEGAPRPLLPEKGGVEAVLSGDSLRLASGRLVRLAGLDAPAYRDPERGEEIFGPESRRALSELVGGRSVRLAYPPGPKASGGDLLAYVSLDDGTDVNAALLEGGFARLDMESAGPARRALFGRLEAEARKGKRGLWGGPVVGNLSSKVYHLPGGRFYHRVSPANRILFATEAEARSAGYRASER